MEETIVTEPNLLEVLVASPLTYIVGLLIVVAIFEIYKGGFYSPKSKKANKTSTPRKAKKATKKTATKKTAKKKVARKRTPKKSGTKN
jgi:hypothetical protein